MSSAEWEAVVGLEVHAHLKTLTKMFCRCELEYGAAENTRTCPVCLAHPGALPVPNGRAIEMTILLGLALDCEIAEHAVFDRKNYFYPDLPKGYQISQYEQPIVQGGVIRIALGASDKVIRLTRAHLEEDAGKLLHEVHGMSGVDFNRAGTPLLEIVSEPDLRGAKEAVAYARALHTLVVWIGICDGNMQEGSFRCDANVSVRQPGAPLGTRCELKNLNSFRFMERAIEYEARRQIELLEDGRRVEQETRLYDPERDETRSLRTKEEAHDYRYFPDPDLLPLVVTEDEIARIGATLPELPEARRTRFEREYSLSAYDARVLTASRAAADYYEAMVKAAGVDPKLCANWQMGELAAALNREERDIADSRISPTDLGWLVSQVARGELTGKMAKRAFEASWEGGISPQLVVEREGLKPIGDRAAIEKLVEDVIAANAQQVADYRAGKQKAFNSLVGQVMKATQGKANPAQVNGLLRKKLGG